MRSPIFRYFLFALGMLISFPLLILLTLLPVTPVSTVGTFYLLGFGLLALGLLMAPWRSRGPLLLLLAGGAIVFVTMTTRVLFPPSGTSMNLITLPGPSGPRLLNRLLDEQDVVLFGTQIAPYLRLITPSENRSLDSKFSAAFQEMNRQGVTPLSPVLTTYLLQQHPKAFDAVVAEPPSGAVPERGIIFLHGFGGGFTLQCWLIAPVGAEIGAITICPSTDPSGAWWSTKGQSILRETIAYLHQRGIEEIYLAGLSNGAIGASRLAEKFKDDINGLLLISGADPDAAIVDGLPVLLLHGIYDERIPAAMMERYASSAGHNSVYRPFEGDHFLLLKQADQVQEVMIDWLREQNLP